MCSSSVQDYGDILVNNMNKVPILMLLRFYVVEVMFELEDLADKK